MDVGPVTFPGDELEAARWAWKRKRLREETQGGADVRGLSVVVMPKCKIREEDGAGQAYV